MCLHWSVEAPFGVTVPVAANDRRDAVKPVGRSRHTVRHPRSRLREFLLSTVAATGLMLLAPTAAQAGCEIDTSTDTATCTGDLSGGLSHSGSGLDAVTKVIVKDLTTNVGPVTGTAVDLSQSSASDDLTIEVETGEFAIEARSASGGQPPGHGINVRTSQGGTATVEFEGNITAGSSGIVAATQGDGDVVVIAEGNIKAGQDQYGVGIWARSDISGDIDIDFAGSIGSDNASTSLVGITAIQSGLGNIEINTSATITAFGDGMDGIRALNSNSNGTTTVTLKGGHVRGGSGDGAGVSFAFSVIGTTNILNIESDATVSAASGIAVRGSDGNDTINNSGKLIGAVDLGAGADRFDLNTDANFSEITLVDGGDGDNDVFELSGQGTATLSDPNRYVNFEKFEKTGQGIWMLEGSHHFAASATISRGTLRLADGSELNAPEVVNEAMLAVGAPAGEIGEATVTGDFEQSDEGIYAVDVNLETETADHLTVSGEATLRGAVNVNIVAYASGTYSIPILTADGGVIENTMTAKAITGGIVNIDLDDVEVVTDGNDVVLSFNVDPDLANPVPDPIDPNDPNVSPRSNPLNENQRRIALAIDDIDAGGTGALDPIVSALITGPTNIDQYRNALNVLLPEVYLNTGTATLFSAHDFMGDLFSCPTVEEGGAVSREGECLWVRPKGRQLEHEGTSENIGYEDSVGGLSAGTQFSFAPGWFVNVAAGYESGSLSTDSGAESDSERYHVGGAMKYEMGPWQFSAAVAAGVGSFETSRRIAFTGFDDGTATSEHDVQYIGGQLRASYHMAMSGWFARPQVDLNVTYLDREGVTETGATTANLVIDDGQETMTSVTPAIAFGGTLEYLVPGAILNPFLVAGVTIFSDDEQSATSAFALAPDASFETTTAHGDTFANIHAGTTIIGDASDLSLALGYKGMFSDNVTQHGVYAKGTLNF
ncbi:MAG: autotransporter outer membrane beta-barrel domain-containing protein [Pseudomonadota bacterium]